MQTSPSLWSRTWSAFSRLVLVSGLSLLPRVLLASSSWSASVDVSSQSERSGASSSSWIGGGSIALPGPGSGGPSTPGSSEPNERLRGKRLINVLQRRVRILPRRLSLGLKCSRSVQALVSEFLESARFSSSSLDMLSKSLSQSPARYLLAASGALLLALVFVAAVASQPEAIPASLPPEHAQVITHTP